MNIGVISPFVFFFLLNAVTVFLSKKKFGKCLPLTLLMATFIVYFSQLIFKTFLIGLIFLAIVSVVGIGLLFFKRKNGEFWVNIFSVGLFTFIITYALFMIIDYGRHYSTWDELSHWGVMVKEMLRLDKFYSVPESNLIIHKEYPPFVSLFEVLWCVISGGYSEARVTRALHVFSLILLNSHIAEEDNLLLKRRIPRLLIKEMLVALTFCLLILSFDKFNIFNTIYIDYFMPILYVYCIILVINKTALKERFGYVSFCVGLSALILTKQMSIAFVLLAYAFFVFSFWMENDVKQWKRKKIDYVFLIMVPAFLACVNYWLWNQYIAYLNIKGQFDLDQINIGGILQIIAGGGTDIQHETCKNYVAALFSQNLFDGIPKMTYITCFLIALFLVAMIWLVNRKTCAKREAVVIGILFMVGTAGYAFTMFVLYMFCYSDYEMRQLASYVRYMDSYIVSEFLILFSWLLLILEKGKVQFTKYISVLVLGSIFLILLYPTKIRKLLPQIIQGEPYVDYEQQACMIQNKTCDEAKIFVVSGKNTQNIYFINYYLNDRKLDTKFLYENISLLDVTDREMWSEIMGEICLNDYIYIMDSSEGVKKEISPYVNNGTVEEYSLYKIEKEKQGFLLIKI